MNYLILESDDELLVNKRDGKGIWQNLYDFPMVESTTSISEPNLNLNKDFQTLLSGSEFKIVVSSKERKHILSHQILFAKFYHIYITDKLEVIKGDFEQIKKTELAKKPIPKLIENYLREETNLLSLSGSLN